MIVTGDVNTAYAEIDIAPPKENAKVSGFEGQSCVGRHSHGGDGVRPLPGEFDAGPVVRVAH